jgi:CelD/BcsL family acetyltransferase involved in cellulose biosynthesis
MSRFTSAGLQVLLVSDPQRFAEMRAEWNRLQATKRSVFLAHEWFDAAWQWRAPDSTLAVVTVRRGDELVGALPLISRIVPSRSGKRRALELLSVPDTQLFDLLAKSSEQAAVLDAMIWWLESGDLPWDILEIGYLPVRSAVETKLAAILRARGYPVALDEAGSNPYIDLESSWETYYASRTRSLKKANNLAANRLRKTGEITIEHYRQSTESPADVAQRLVPLLADISGRSWKRYTGNSLDSPGPQSFIRRLTERTVERGWLSVWALRLNGIALAMEYQLVFDGNVHALRSDFDAAFSEISPGSHLFRDLLEKLFGMGLRRYYMGPGENAYKLRWADKAEPLRRMRAYSRSPGGRLAAFVDLRVLPVARAVRDRLAPKNLAVSATESERGK